MAVGSGVGSGWARGVKDAAMTPRPMLAVSTTAEPPATSLYSGRRAKALPEKYFMGFRLLNILSSLFPFIEFYYCLWSSYHKGSPGRKGAGAKKLVNFAKTDVPILFNLPHFGSFLADMVVILP